MRSTLLLLVGSLLVGSGSTAHGASRVEVDLSGSGWTLWRDEAAGWEEEALFLPPVDLAKVAGHAPTEGWDVLGSAKAISVSVPGTAEQYLQKVPGPAGDITGVTWWCRQITVPAGALPRRVVLCFESARQCAEVYVNQKLVAYDLIGNTPFKVDLSDLLQPGQTAQLAVRIVDPGGNFDWHDKGLIPWGNQRILLSHGFGGITGRVKLIACDPVSIDDLYVQNTREFTTINTEVEIINTTAAEVRRSVLVRVLDRNDPTHVLATQTIENAALPPGTSIARATVSAPQASLWDVDHPHLYRCEASLHDPAAGAEAGDAVSRVFGFRWFEPVGIGSDAMFRLNGKRIVLRSAISWGFFPINGIYATPEMAEKQIRIAKAMGLNMLSFHRAIGQPIIFEKADELGLLYYEEPGNYASGPGGKDQIPRVMAREKLLRMVRRDRSHPSLIIYNMANESGADGAVLDEFVADMKLAHAIDPSRTITRTSGLRSTPGIDVELANKYHMRPFDQTVYKSGWYDDHHAGGMPVWSQEGYVSPQKYLQRVENPKEIVYWGEEGALSTPPRLGLIRDQLSHSPQLGWDGQMYLDWYAMFDKFLTEKNLRASFPTVDDLCVAMGNISMQHQGRRIQAIRINNDTDGYAINGWEAEIIENHSGIVDCFRNPKGDPAIIARYNRPCYVAVMPRKQILPAGAEATVDFYAINEIGLKGAHELHMAAEDAHGKRIFEKDFNVSLIGGDQYGQLLTEGVAIRLPESLEGMLRIKASLRGSDGAEAASGSDDLLVVDWKNQLLAGKGAVLDATGNATKFLRERKALAVEDFNDNAGKLDWIVAASSPSPQSLALVPASALRGTGGKMGLLATFFNNIDFSDKAAERTMAAVDLTAPDGAPPDASVNTLQNYSVRWEGELVPPATGEYAFAMDVTGEATVMINGKEAAGPDALVQLTAGQAVSLQVQWRQRAGDARCKLLWRVPSDKPAFDPARLVNRIREDGTTLIVLTNASEWAKTLAALDSSIKYNDSFIVGKAWSGGVHFVRAHPLFKDLPTNCGMDWPYQAVVRDGTSRSGLLLDGDQLVAGAFHANMSEAKPPVSIRLGTAVGIVRVGKGRIIFSTLDIAGNLSQPDGPADVARKLLCNFIAYASE